MRKVCPRLNKFLLASAVLLVSASVTPAFSQSRIDQSPRPILAAEQCQPLSELNYELCCVALNRDDLLTAGQIDECPPLTTSRLQEILENFGDHTTTGSIDPNPNNPNNPNGPDGGLGNPGNDEPVGKAGEGPGPHSASSFGPSGSRGRSE